jgi:SAM-dependent methyltransferase
MEVEASAINTLRRFAFFLRRRLGRGARPGLDELRFEPGGASLQSVHDARRLVAAAFLKGDGIEIGALHQPLPVPASARVRYLDRMTVSELRRQYKELKAAPLVETDIIDDGELLTTVADGTQDFVIANHFIEHCQNPILTFQNLFRVLKPRGVLYLAVPDKRFTFDADRPCTTTDHLMRDFTEGPAWSKRQHFEEWSRLVNKRADREVAEEVRHLIEIDYSIHFHVWGATELLEFLAAVQRIVPFEIELFLRNGHESIVVLRRPVPDQH